MRHFLPRRPLQLDARALAQRRLRNLAVVAVLIAMGAAFGAGSFVSGQQVISERVLWSRGMLGRVVHVSGKVEQTEKLGLTLFYDYDLDVKWVDAQGHQHAGKTTFGRTFRGIGKREHPRLKYDPTLPDRFVLSWAAEGGLSRAGLALICAALAAAMLVCARTLVRVERERLQLLHMCAEDGEEMLCPVQKAASHKGVHYVKYLVPDEDRFRVYRGEAPFLVQRDGELHVLTLRSPRAPHLPYVVEANLRPFELPVEVRARILTAASG
jgi:hypothetical protein